MIIKNKKLTRKFCVPFPCFLSVLLATWMEQQVSESLTGVTRTRGNQNVASRPAGVTSPLLSNHWATRTQWRVWTAAEAGAAATPAAAPRRTNEAAKPRTMSGTRTRINPGAKTSKSTPAGASSSRTTTTTTTTSAKAMPESKRNARHFYPSVRRERKWCIRARGCELRAHFTQSVNYETPVEDHSFKKKFFLYSLKDA